MLPPITNVRIITKTVSLMNRYIKSPKQTMWVAANGNDSTGKGTEVKPFATIPKAASYLGAGGQVRVKAGVYHTPRIMIEIGGTVGAPLQIVSDIPYGAKIIVSATGWAAVVIKKDYTDFIGFDVSAPGTNITSGVETQASHCTIAYNFIHDIPSSDPSTGGGGIHAFDGDIGRSDVNSYQNVVVRIGTGITGGAIRGDTDARWHIHGVYYEVSGHVSGNFVCSTSGHSIQTYHTNARNFIAEYNTCLNAWRSGILVSNSLPLGNTGSQVRHNLSAHHRLGGYAASNSVGAIFDKNLWWDCPSGAIIDGGKGTLATNWSTSNPSFTKYQADGSGDYHSPIQLGYYAFPML